MRRKLKLWAGDKISPVSFFIIASVVAYILYSCYRPPMQSPDEYFHFCRAYQISEGQFLPVTKDQRVGGELPVCVKEYLSLYMPLTFIPQYKTSTAKFFGSSGIACLDSARVFIDFPNTSTYSPVAYLPHTVALFVLRQFDCPIGVLYHGSKLFAFIVYLLCMVYAIKAIPVYKWLFVALLLLPMQLYMLNSFTGDTMTNLLTFMLIALVLKHRFSEKKISVKDLAVILLIGILLAFAKVIYSSLLVLLVMIPAARFRSKLHKWLSLAVLILIPFLLANIWSGMVMKNYLTYEQYNVSYRDHCTIHPTADHHRQLAHLLSNKTHFFKVLYNSLTADPKFYLRSYIGYFGTYMDMPLPGWVVIAAYALIILIAVFEKNAVQLSWHNKLLMLAAALMAYSLIIFSQHLIWNAVGSEKFSTFQGRYLAPLFPLIFMLFDHPWQRIRFSPALIVMAAVIFWNGSALERLNKRYFDGRNVSKVELSCGAEELDAHHNMVTSDDDITLSGSDKRTSAVARTGKYAVKLEPDSSKSFIYRFKDLRPGDLVEIYAWQKGTGGLIVVEGKGDCDPYRFINKDIQLTDKKGWKKMQMIFTSFVPCDSSEVSFFVQNLSGETVYFDDISYCVKKFRK